MLAIKTILNQQKLPKSSNSSISISQVTPYKIESSTFGVGRGKSVYDIAVENGFQGTELEYLRSLIGLSAYEVALSDGFVGTQEEWIESLKGDSAYEVALSVGFVGTQEEWLEYIRWGSAVTTETTGMVLTNDGTNTLWQTIEDKLNESTIQWDLGEI